VSRDPGEDERAAVESVASLRLATARYPDDPGMRRLVDELREGSPRFAGLWDAGRAAPGRPEAEALALLRVVGLQDLEGATRR
jgi:MmyB-like transcription regulator ligand binding domain